MADSVLVLRTHSGVDVWTAEDGRVHGDAVPAIEAALAPHGATLAPLAGEPAWRLQARRAGERAVADMGCYFGVQLRGPADDELLQRIREAPAVEFAYVKPPVALPTIPPSELGVEPATGPEPQGPPEDLSDRQGYLHAAPEGIGASAAWGRPGGRGSGVRIIDVEADWRFSHEDLQHEAGGMIAGHPGDDVERRNHGTNVLGMLGAVHNGRGVSGICPDAMIRGVSYEPEDPWGTARAIKLAADALRPGDILLLEMMRPGPRTPEPGDPGYTPTTQLGYLPVEYWPDDLTAIQYAVSRGIVVVEAAGNGHQQLDDRIYGGRGPGFRERRPNPFAREELDSGAILVGAGAPPPGTHGAEHGPDRSRLDYSNCGLAIDAQGWGYEVTTTGGLGTGPDELRPGPFEDRWYTDRFNGTSSAAPMVAGALACVQGMLRAAGRDPLTPDQVRKGLRETGSAQTGSEDPLERIGNRPDVSRLFEWALHAPPPDPRSPRRRRRPMRVTITIDDDDAWGPPGNQPPYVRGPYVRGPSLVIPKADGSETVIEIDALEAAADQTKQA
jgi:subtilase family protein